MKNFDKYLNNFDVEQLLNCLPENRPIYKDSGLWQVRTDDMNDVYMYQKSNESFKDFIIRYINFINENEPELVELPMAF